MSKGLFIIKPVAPAGHVDAGEPVEGSLQGEATLKRTPREYAADGRIFCGVELYEGEETVRSIIEVLGDDTIMYQSDYPHDQCAFPK